MRESKLWSMFLFAGLGMVILLGIHMFAQHMGTFLSIFGIQIGDPLAYENVIGRASSLGWTVFYIVLLAFALYHGLYGLRSIFIEVVPSAGNVISSVLILVGIVAFIFGVYVTWTSYALGGVL